MRIVNIVTQMEAGGAQQAAVNISAVLLNKGYEAEVWFLYMKRPTYHGCKGVRVILNRKPAITDYILIFFGLIKLLRMYRPEVVITHTYYANIMGQAAAFLAGVRTRLAVQHNPVFTYPKLARFLDFLTGSLGFYDFNIAVSKAAFASFDSYPHAYKKRLRIIPNGIPAAQPKLSMKNARCRFGLPVEGKLMVNVGRLAAQKNQTLLIRILKNLPGVYLAIAGEGELRTALEKEAHALGTSSRLFLLGEIAPADIGNFLAAGDVFVFPSLFEALPFALVEAMSAGLPVIASDIPSLREVLTNSKGEPAGLLVCLKDEYGFCEAVRKVLEDSALAVRLSRLSKERAGFFNLDQMVGNYEQCFM